MKLSNKILIGFFSIGMLYTFAVMLEVRLYGKYTFWRDGEIRGDIITETRSIDHPKFLSLTGNRRYVKIVQSDNPRVEIQSLDGNLLSQISIAEEADTLTIDYASFSPKDMYTMVVYLPAQDTLDLATTAAFLRLDSINLAQLNVQQAGGNIRLAEDSEVTKLAINATDTARFDVTDSRVDSIQVGLDKRSVVSILSEVKHLSGTLIQKSLLVAEEPRKIQVSRDDSSSIRIIDR